MRSAVERHRYVMGRLAVASRGPPRESYSNYYLNGVAPGAGAKRKVYPR